MSIAESQPQSIDFDDKLKLDQIFYKGNKPKIFVFSKAKDERNFKN